MKKTFLLPRAELKARNISWGTLYEDSKGLEGQKLISNGSYSYFRDQKDRKSNRIKNTYNTNLDWVFDCFKYHPITYYTTWLRKIEPLINSDQQLQFDISSCDKNNLQIDLSNTKSINILEINLTDLTLDDLQKLLKKIDGKSILRIKLTGTSNLSNAILKQFIEQLYHASFIAVSEDENPELADFAEKITHRNHYMHELNISPKANVWKTIIQTWIKASGLHREGGYTGLDRLYYLKPVDEAGANSYKKILEDLEAKPEEENNSPITHQIIGDCYERYSNLNAGIAGMGDIFFEKLLENLDDVYAVCKQDNFTINKILTENQLKKLVQYVIQNNVLPFTTLSLHVTKDVVQSSAFIQLIKALENSSIFSLEITFPHDDFNDIEAMDKLLNETIVPHASFLIRLARMHSWQPTLPQFQASIIQKVQQRNIKKLNQEPVAENKSAALEEKTAPIIENVFAKTLKLKDLIHSSNENDGLIKLEVQHAEVEQQQQTQNVEEIAEVVAQVNVAQQEAFAQYDGELIDSEKFDKQPYRGIISALRPNFARIENTILIHQECFGNFSKAIKFMSESAAQEVARNLPSYSTLNPDNLPQGFSLKQTSAGEIVLDFDAYAEEHKTNVFTPKPYKNYNNEDPIYYVNLDEKQIEALVDNRILFEKAFTYHAPAGRAFNHASPLKNMWIRFGYEGIQKFFAAINAVEAKSQGYSSLLHDYYLRNFTHWDHFLDTPDFLNTIEKMVNFNQTKFVVLFKFLNNTGKSCHNLTDTVAAFEIFWEKVSALFDAQKVDINKLQLSNWTTPRGGNPIVYMERLLTIFTHARDLNEQVEELCKFDIIPKNETLLANYGGYYASKYEGFKLISNDMELWYNRSKQNTIPFNPNLANHGVSLAQLCDYAKTKRGWASDNTIPPKFTTDKIEALAYRIIGQQQHSIKLEDFRLDLNKYYSNWYGTPPDRTSEIIVALFFIIHERYQRTYTATQLLKEAERATNDSSVVHHLNQGLLDLYEMDVKINDIESQGILRPIGDLNSAYFDGLYVEKAAHLNKMFAYLKKNKFGGLKALARYCMIEGIDAALVLEEDTAIAAAFRDNILLFSGLLNSKEKYFANRAENYRARNPLNYVKKEEKKAKIIQYAAEIEESSKKTYDKLLIVKQYLHQAAVNALPNNLYYAFNLIAESANDFTYDMLLQAFKTIEELTEFNPKVVTEILQNANFNLSQSISSTTITRDNSDLKNTLIMILMFAKRLEIPGVSLTNIMTTELPEEVAYKYSAELQDKSVKELQEIYNQAVKNSGYMLATMANGFISKILTNLKDSYIDNSFSRVANTNIGPLLQAGIKSLSDFAGPYNFEKVNQIAEQSQTLSDLVSNLTQKDNYRKHAWEIWASFNSISYSTITYSTLYSLISLLDKMSNRNYQKILAALLQNRSDITNQDTFISLLGHVERLHVAQIPSEYIETLIPFISENVQQQDLYLLIMQVTNLFTKNNNDVLLDLVIKIVKNKTLDLKSVNTLLNLANFYQDVNKEQVHALLEELIKRNQLFTIVSGLNTNLVSSAKILEIMARVASYSANKDINYSALLAGLDGLTPAELTRLDEFTSQTIMSLQALDNCIKAVKNNINLEQFLLIFEKAPFGNRDLKRQFDVSMVERVINDSKDLRNDSRYTLQYRKQLMEAFLFVNKAGCELPIYNNKPAKELTNKEIRHLFHALKLGQLPELDTQFKRNLYALGLMRESMYRSTGKFPYSTQMIAMIDCMLHEGDVISGIDCGQGKSLIDVMKASLLWLNSDRVDITTSSSVDAKRDIKAFGLYLEALGIPYSKNVISAASEITDFQQGGINFSTCSQLSLFFHRAKAQGIDIDNGLQRISLVANESDHAILDDRTVFRYAITNSAGVGENNEWIYDAINQFITSCSQEISLQQAINELRQHLSKHASLNNRSPKLIRRFEDEQLGTWIKSAIAVNFRLRENFDYVIPQEPEMRLVNGALRPSRVIKILFKDDGKVSPDTTYGDGIQQLLYAKLNKQYPRLDVPFVIEPETKTIISTNNKNLFDYYRSKNGYIWGSSGTVGSSAEIQTQYENYGFEFSKIEPHQKYIVSTHKPEILVNEDKHFAAVYKRISKIQGKKHNTGLVFLKDIETAKRFHAYLLQKDAEKFGELSQLFLGTGDEAEVIRQAARPGMITITTPALGRNTDVLYDKKVGMKIIHTSMAGLRATEQKSRRTGREGSPGEVFFILNREDLGNRSVEEVQKIIEARTAQEREFNEELYNILGYLFASLRNLQTEHLQTGSLNGFLKSQWSKFSEERENRYRDLKLNNSYNREAFTAETVRLFNLMLQETIKAGDVVGVSLDKLTADLAHRHPTMRHYQASTKRVKMADCTPPEIIAYHFLGESNFAEAKAPNKDEIKLHLKTLFKTNAKKLVANNQAYINYLNNNAANLHTVRQAHQEFLSEFIQDKTVKAKRGFFKRWLGFQSDLSKITDDRNYLLLFKAISAVPGSKNMVPFENVRGAMVALLNEYLASSWFISKRRNLEVRCLIGNLGKATDRTDLTSILVDTKLAMLKTDIVENKSILRFFRPLNRKGSRAQTVIDKALDLTSALTGADAAPKLTVALQNELKSISKNPEVLEVITNEQSQEAFEKGVSKLKVKDSANAKVIEKSLEKSLARREFYKSPTGMFGRKNNYEVPVAVKESKLKK